MTSTSSGAAHKAGPLHHPTRAGSRSCHHCCTDASRNGVDVYALEFVVNLRWLLHHVAHRLHPCIASAYPAITAPAREMGDYLLLLSTCQPLRRAVVYRDARSHCSSNSTDAGSLASLSASREEGLLDETDSMNSTMLLGSLETVPVGALNLARAGLIYLLATENLLGNAPDTLHEFLARCAGPQSGCVCMQSLPTSACGQVDYHEGADLSRHYAHNSTINVDESDANDNTGHCSEDQQVNSTQSFSDGAGSPSHSRTRLSWFKNCTHSHLLPDIHEVNSNVAHGSNKENRPWRDSDVVHTSHYTRCHTNIPDAFMSSRTPAAFAFQSCHTHTLGPTSTHAGYGDVAASFSGEPPAKASWVGGRKVADTESSEANAMLLLLRWLSAEQILPQEALMQALHLRTQKEHDNRDAMHYNTHLSNKDGGSASAGMNPSECHSAHAPHASSKQVDAPLPNTLPTPLSTHQADKVTHASSRKRQNSTCSRSSADHSMDVMGSFGQQQAMAVRLARLSPFSLHGHLLLTRLLVMLRTRDSWGVTCAAVLAHTRQLVQFLTWTAPFVPTLSPSGDDVRLPLHSVRAMMEEQSLSKVRTVEQALQRWCCVVLLLLHEDVSAMTTTTATTLSKSSVAFTIHNNTHVSRNSSDDMDKVHAATEERNDNYTELRCCVVRMLHQLAQPDCDFARALSDGVLMGLVMHRYEPRKLPWTRLCLSTAMHSARHTIVQQHEQRDKGSASDGARRRWQCCHNWQCVLRAAEDLGIWPGMTAAEAAIHGSSTLLAHTIRLLEETFILFTTRLGQRGVWACSARTTAATSAMASTDTTYTCVTLPCRSRPRFEVLASSCVDVEVTATPTASLHRCRRGSPSAIHDSVSSLSTSSSVSSSSCVSSFVSSSSSSTAARTSSSAASSSTSTSPLSNVSVSADNTTGQQTIVTCCPGEVTRAESDDDGAFESDEEPLPLLRPMIHSTSLTCSSKFLSPMDACRQEVGS